MERYKLVVRDKNGKVIQIHERYESDPDFVRLIQSEADCGYSITVSNLNGQSNLHKQIGEELV